MNEAKERKKEAMLEERNSKPATTKPTGTHAAITWDGFGNSLFEEFPTMAGAIDRLKELSGKRYGYAVKIYAELDAGSGEVLQVR